MKYLVPDYYHSFKCKCGECRSSCCDGWPVRISRGEYYRLVGAVCSDELRSRLDRALKLCPEPGEECFAEISYDWNGICRLHREDGLCALQAELGEDSLPEVCRLFPRSTKRLGEVCECSCSNGCEAVVELLMKRTEPMGFSEAEHSSPPKFELKLTLSAQEVCRSSILHLQNRSLSLSERLTRLGNYLTEAGYFSPNPENRSLAYRVLLAFDRFYEDSVSVGDYCIASQRYYNVEGKELLTEKELALTDKKYLAAALHLNTIYPEWPILLEQLLVNHMFYNRFPYSLPQSDKHDAFLTLAITYGFLRINLLGYMADKKDASELPDVLAAMFRMIDHSDFQSIAAKLFRNIKIPVQQCVPELISL